MNFSTLILALRKPTLKRVGPALGVLLSLLPAAPAAAQQAFPKLALNSPIIVPGGSLGVTVTGTPGATIKIVVTKTPAEIRRGAAGIQFFKAATQATLASGTIPASGRFTRTLSVPLTAQVGGISYAQAISQLDGQTRFGNSIAYRVDGTLPSGARKTASIAVTPDGSRAFVADVLSGVVTVIDAQNDVKLANLPITVSARDIPHRPVRVVVDPEGRHAFVSNAAASNIAVIHTATGSISAQIPVPRGCRGVGFDFHDGIRLVYVANETTQSVLAYEEAPLGTFTAIGSIPLETSAPGPLLVLPDGRIAVGTRTDHAIEILDPQGAPGATTLALAFISGLPFDLAWDGSAILVPTFIPLGENRVVGFNRVLRLDPTSYELMDNLFENLGTDFRSIAVQPTTDEMPLIAVNASGTGTTLIADGASDEVLDVVDLSYGWYPGTTPEALAIVNDAATGLPSKIYVLDYFRETLRPILLDGGPPYALAPEVPLAWSGQVREPLSGTLSNADDGEWFFRNVVSFGGTAFEPNPVTCSTCHVDGGSDNSLIHDFQVPSAWGALATGPYFWAGSIPTIQNIAHGALRMHNHTGILPPAGTETSLLSFLAALDPPLSIFLNQDGTMNAQQLAGKALFEGAANCTQCHAGPTFTPPAGSPLTIVSGIGTGLAPANVPSLRGIWATAPYLHDGSAWTLLDVLSSNPLDAHGQATAALSEGELSQLVEYLQAL